MNLSNYTEFIEAGLDQRPHIRGSLADDKITLHDAVMMDDPAGQEDLLNKILTTYQQAHSKPSPRESHNYMYLKI